MVRLSLTFQFDLKVVADFRSRIAYRSNGKFQNSVSPPEHPCNAERTYSLTYAKHAMVLVYENYVDGEGHSNGVNRLRRHNE
jgi:hypothetical protein